MTPKKRDIRAVKAFNKKHSVGDWVLLKEDGSDDLLPVMTKSEAFISCSGHAVIFLENISGYYLLTHVYSNREKPVSESKQPRVIDIDDLADALTAAGYFDGATSDFKAGKAAHNLATFVVGYLGLKVKEESDDPAP